MKGLGSRVYCLGAGLGLGFQGLRVKGLMFGG